MTLLHLVLMMHHHLLVLLCWRELILASHGVLVLLLSHATLIARPVPVKSAWVSHPGSLRVVWLRLLRNRGTRLLRLASRRPSAVSSLLILALLRVGARATSRLRLRLLLLLLLNRLLLLLWLLRCFRF